MVLTRLAYAAYRTFVSVVSSALPSDRISHIFSSESRVCCRLFGRGFRGGGVEKSGRGSERSWSTPSTSCAFLSSLAMLYLYVYSLCPIARYKQIRVGGEAREVDGSCLYREETNGSVPEKQRVSFAPETSDDTRGYLAGTSHKRTAAVCVCGVCPFCGWCIHIPYVIRRFSSEKLPRTTATLPPSIEPPSPLRRPNTQTTPPSWLLCTLSQAARSDRTSYVVPATPEAQNFDATSAALAHSSSCSLQAVFAGSAKLKQKALAHGNDLQTRHRLIR